MARMCGSQRNLYLVTNVTIWMNTRVGLNGRKQVTVGMGRLAAQRGAARTARTGDTAGTAVTPDTAVMAGTAVTSSTSWSSK